ncbi:glycyl-radical enzyme activating protein family [Desulforamulus reducens MI-1]|uniref:Glycyl-radical enzyme activating protein family n=1 Tax=Desulforamulus reducens (strain ATCC BAA-1160 / DSM 100696 / MI-1) TaxID=349161 RepID=A4J853_DESRM|nr:glycyl-radical enzyme activating protein [Desulforamulus reducens]ABO51256.1 glycyl-radical enzyme activating protein family [Desulforamulus reducens MI-1]
MVAATNFDKKKYGYVFNVQRYSVHDGPGIRTIVFLKGCPLRCQWCANPESQHFHPELAYNANKCISIKECGWCIKSCETEAIKHDQNGKITVDRERCTNCGKCTDICPSKALNMYGELKRVDEVIELVEQDSSFYMRSGGGITLSGGEPLVQAEFALEVLKEAKRRRLNTAIETCGYADWEKAVTVFEYVDNILFDIKSINSTRHKQFTGVGNETILENFKKLCNCFPNTPITVRTPVIPGFNDTEQDILAIIDFIKCYPNVKYEILAYHRLGEPKYTYIGREYLLSGVKPIPEERISTLKKLVQENFPQ